MMSDPLLLTITAGLSLVNTLVSMFNVRTTRKTRKAVSTLETYNKDFRGSLEKVLGEKVYNDWLENQKKVSGE